MCDNSDVASDGGSNVAVSSHSDIESDDDFDWAGMVEGVVLQGKRLRYDSYKDGVRFVCVAPRLAHPYTRWANFVQTKKLEQTKLHS